MQCRLVVITLLTLPNSTMFSGRYMEMERQVLNKIDSSVELSGLYQKSDRDTWVRTSESFVNKLQNISDFSALDQNTRNLPQLSGFQHSNIRVISFVYHTQRAVLSTLVGICRQCVFSHHHAWFTL